jgi:hypothetical protein
VSIINNIVYFNSHIFFYFKQTEKIVYLCPFINNLKSIRSDDMVIEFTSPYAIYHITTFYSCDFDYRPCLGVLDTTCSVTPTTKIGYNDITDYIVESERR